MLAKVKLKKVTFRKLIKLTKNLISKREINKIKQLINLAKQHHFRGRRVGFPFGYYNMIALDMMGAKYPVIARTTGYSYSWVKHLFAYNGNVRRLIRGTYDPNERAKYRHKPKWLKEILEKSKEGKS